MCYILQPEWSLLLLVNTQSSLYCKQCMSLVNIIVNKVANSVPGIVMAVEKHWTGHFFPTLHKI